MIVAFSSYFFWMKSASKVCTPRRYWSIACVALSLERTDWSLKFDNATGTLREPPKRSQWISCASEIFSGPRSYFTALDQTWGRRVAVSASSVEYCVEASKPARLGVSYCTTFARRKWKLDAELVPKPPLRSTLLVETKLPLETPRKDRSSPYFLNGVSIRPSLMVP